MYILPEEVDYQDFLINIGIAVISQCLKDEKLARESSFKSDRQVSNFINGKNFEYWLDIFGVDKSLYPKYKKAFWDSINATNNKQD